jgi:CheY-like chemotaxis protein
MQKSILVVDEDPIFRRRLRQELDGAYQVLEVDHANKALALVLEKYPDCILVDLDLAELAGVELCTVLSDLNQTKLIPIIALTKYPAARPDEVRKALHVSGLVRKPVDWQELKESVATALAARQSERRREVRVHLAVALRIVGAAAAGRAFDTLLTTHDVSTSGFSCQTPLVLPIGSTLETWMTLAHKPTTSGRAVVVRVEKQGTPEQRYGFQFVQKPENWILQ